MKFKLGQLVILRSSNLKVNCVWALPKATGGMTLGFPIQNETYALYIGKPTCFIEPRYYVLIGEEIVSVPWTDLVPV